MKWDQEPYDQDRGLRDALGGVFALLVILLMFVALVVWGVWTATHGYAAPAPSPTPCGPTEIACRIIPTPNSTPVPPTITAQASCSGTVTFTESAPLGLFLQIDNGPLSVIPGSPWKVGPISAGHHTYDIMGDTGSFDVPACPPVPATGAGL